jgi:cytochrome b6-f complex iron-sulfur subunit
MADRDDQTPETPDDAPDTMSRRSFSALILKGSVATTVLGSFYVALSYLHAPRSARATENQPVSAGPASEIPEGESKIVEFAGNPVIVIHSKDGFVALSAVCTHLGCTVEFDPKRGLIICPCHNGIYDLRGNVLSGPPPRPLPAYGVSVVEGQVTVAEA